MDDLRETVNAALRTFHNSSCYPSALDSDLQIGRELVFAAIHASGHRIVPVELVEASSDLFAALAKYGPTPVGRDKSITEPHGRLGRALTAYGQGDKP